MILLTCLPGEYRNARKRTGHMWLAFTDSNNKSPMVTLKTAPFEKSFRMPCVSMKSAIQRALVCLALLLPLSGCGVFLPYVYDAGKLEDHLAVATPKEQVLKNLGKPDRVVQDDGQQAIWEYRLYPKGESFRMPDDLLEGWAALTGTLVHIATGTFTEGVHRTIGLAIGVVIGAQIGARLSERIRGRWIIRGLTLALGLVSIRILFVALGN